MSTLSGGNNDFINRDYLQLQNQTKRDPESFHDDYKQQMNYFNQSITIYQQTSSSSSSSAASNSRQTNASMKHFCQLISYLAHVAQCYKQEVLESGFPTVLLNMLDSRFDALHGTLRKTVVQSLILLQNRELISRFELLPVFFKAFACHNKQLRMQLFSHIVQDIRRVNSVKKNVKLNNSLQNFMFRMLAGDSDIAAKKSLEVMVELWRRKVWNDPKTANAVCSACFSPHSRLLSRALAFLCGLPYYDELEEEEEEANRDGEMKQAQEKLQKTTYIARTKKREREFRRTMTKLKNKQKEREDDSSLRSGSYDAITLLYDPQGFVERLFSKLRQSTEPFQIRLQMMNVISRVIGAHKLVLDNFYPFLQKYIQPHQKHVTNVLAYFAQACHELVPPDFIQPTLRALCHNFVTDRSRPEAVAVGINAVREVCQRCPLAMEEDMLRDLVEYRKNKNKSIMMAARSLLTVFREINPALLHKKDRGRKDQMLLSAGQKHVLGFGEVKLDHDIAGLEYLDQDSSAEEEEEEREEEEEDEDDDENQDDEKNKNEPPELVSDTLTSSSSTTTTTATSSSSAASSIAASRFLSAEDFEKIERRRMAALLNPQNARKRKHHDIAMMEDGEFEDEDGQAWRDGDGKIDPESLHGYRKRMKSTKESRLASIIAGRDGNYKHGHRNTVKQASSSNREKEKLKHHMMLRKGKGLKPTKMTARQRVKNTKLKAMRKGQANSNKSKGMKKHRVSGKRNRK